jgi:mRNA-degrading endonuclease RelE of RelBE toxin-antitoxin system
LLRFVHLKPFERDWKDLRLDDDDLFGLQVAIMLNPKGPPVVQGTGGLRKIRFAPARSGKGKSGGIRVGYAYLEEYGTVLLIVAYGKNEKDDLSADERKEIGRLIDQIEQEFATGVIK